MPGGKTRLSGQNDTAVPATEVGCVVTATVTGAEVGNAGIAVGLPETAIRVFVGRGAALVEGATDTDMSHAKATTIKRQMNKMGFFVIMVLMA
jgi:hypothetical protein